MKRTNEPLFSLILSALVAFVCCGCATARGFRNLRESEISRHAPAGLAFPAQAGQFQRSFAQVSVNDNAGMRVGYSHLRRDSPHLVIITVEPRVTDPTELLKLRQQTLQAAHPDAAIASDVSGSSLELFRDWQAVVFNYHGFVADFPPGMRYQPR